MHADCVLGDTIKNMESCQITHFHMASDQGHRGLVCTCGVEEQVLSLPEIDSRL